MGQTTSDYPFTMQQQYPTANYPSSLPDDYSLDDLMTNSWAADETDTPDAVKTSPPRPPQHHHQQQQPAMPDAVINMAAKVGSDKKPFAYIDINDIRQQRDRVRRKYVSPVFSSKFR